MTAEELFQSNNVETGGSQRTDCLPPCTPKGDYSPTDWPSDAGLRGQVSHLRNLRILLYTDGSSLGNPGRGGYGVVLKCGTHYKEMSGGFPDTTNNRMELTAVIVGLEAIKWENADVTVYSDSSYVVNAVNKGWVFGWEKKGFDKKANPDLWIRFLAIYRKHRVTFVWIKGHAGHPENERCDRLAVAAAESVPIAAS